MKFKKIYIEITNYCNLHCSFCSIDNKPKREMRIDEFKTVLDKVYQYTESIYLHVKGEPLLYSKLDELLNITDSYPIKVCITTNGTLIKEKKDILLKHKIKQINISLHSENNKKNYLEDVINTSNELSKKTTIIYRIWVNNNEDRIYQELNKYYDVNINDLKNNKNIKLIDNIYLDKDEEFIWPNLDNKNDNSYGTCYGTRSHIAILSDGTVVPCCLDSSGIINLGNIFNSDLKDILDSKLFKDIHHGFQNNKIIHDLCKKCTYRMRFNSGGNNESRY